MNGSQFDRLARELTQPMPRRHALRLAGVAFVVAAVPGLRPPVARASGCGGILPLKCSAPPDSSGNAAFVCGLKGGHCCSSDKCALVCKPWERCSAGAGCDDSPRLCSDPNAPMFDKAKPKFCKVRLESTDLCFGKRTLDYGWCCRAGETCGEKQLECSCEGEDCGSTCCEEGKVCADSVTGVCCPKNWNHCKGTSIGIVGCCPPRDECCFNPRTKKSVCCDKKHPCTNGRCKCDKNEKPCGDKNCCGGATPVCSKGKCCPKKQVNCGDGHCCKAGDCCGGVCCPSPGVCDSGFCLS
jgi:hypothetical protein